MTRYLIGRLFWCIPVMLGASVLIFVLLRFLPGDVVDIIIGSEGSATPEVRATIRRLFGLDQPIYVQYLVWIGAVLRGDLGSSLRTSQPVGGLLLSRLPITIELAFLSVGISVLLAVPLGVLAAVKRGGPAELVSRLVGLVGLSLPNFWLATMLILIASLGFGWLPSLIYVSPLSNPIENLKQMLMPAVSLALALMAIVLRMTRSAMLEVLSQEYVKTARAKGLAERVVLMRHALKNAMIPVITVVGIQMGTLFGSTVVIEQIFGLPGMGWTFVNGIYQRDYPTVQGAVLMLALTFVFVNLLVDMAYAYLDPRIRYG
ncbi:MAG TPA: ABC transporter permease [Chloroflexota bacterium]|nr:ABC transporter permease [Chloroflexota bacterium]